MDIKAEIDALILKRYEEIKKGKIISRIEELHAEIRFQAPELANYIKKEMYRIAKEKGDLP